MAGARDELLFEWLQIFEEQFDVSSHGWNRVLSQAETFPP